MVHNIFLSHIRCFFGGLGEDWNNYARSTIYKKTEDAKVYSQGDTIFNTALEIWLELRRDINYDIGSKKTDTNETSEGSNNDISTEEQASVDDKKEKEKEDVDKLNDQLNELDSETADTKFEDNIVFESFDLKLREKFKNHEIGNIFILSSSCLKFQMMLVTMQLLEHSTSQRSKCGERRLAVVCSTR